MNYIIDWGLVPTEEEEPYLLGKRPAEGSLQQYWFAGYGEEGERKWVKARSSAMTFPTLEEVTKMWNDLELGTEGFAVGGPKNTTTFKV